MKTIIERVSGIVLLVVAIWLFGGCDEKFLNNTEQIVGSGTLTTRTVSTPEFSGIVLTGIGEVYVTQDSVQSVRIEADDNIIDRLQLDVHSGKLNVGIQQGSYSHVTIKIYISMKSVESLELTGAGNFATVGPIDAATLSCTISGAGNMTLTGRAVQEIVALQGAGSIHGFDLESARCSVMLSGTGSAEVNVTQHLDATVSGVGSVIYAGNPPEVIGHVSGVGSIHRK